MIFHMPTSSPQNENTVMSSMGLCNDSLADAMCTEIIGDHSPLKMIQVPMTPSCIRSFFESRFVTVYLLKGKKCCSLWDLDGIHCCSFWGVDGIEKQSMLYME